MSNHTERLFRRSLEAVLEAGLTVSDPRGVRWRARPRAHSRAVLTLSMMNPDGSLDDGAYSVSTVLENYGPLSPVKRSNR